MKKKITFFLIICILIPMLNGFASELPKDTYIRVGLVTYYANVDEINIYNNRIAIGFEGSTSDVFNTEARLYSANGFLVEPDSAYYCIATNTYNTYMDARIAQKQLSEKGVSAIVCVAAEGVWKLFVYGGNTQEEADAVLLNIDGVLDMRFYSAADNNERVRIVGENLLIICDNGSGKIQYEALPEDYIDFDNLKEVILPEVPTVTVTTEEPTVTITTEEPTVTITTEEPTVTITTEEPTITVTTEEPTVTITTEEPTVTITTEEPTITVTTEEPTVTITTEEPIVVTTTTEELNESEIQAVSHKNYYTAVLPDDVTVTQTIEYEVKPPLVINLGNRRYRGRIELGRYREKGITAVNVLKFEEYLYGVVPAEIISSWPEEALKTQAVAARTYAYYYTTIDRKFPNKAYDVCDTTTSQVYKGYGIEVESTNAAVDNTRGEMVYYGNKIISTFFFSTSGGHTESARNVWSSTAIYYTGVPDIFETEPERKPWIITRTKEYIEQKCLDKGINIGSILDIEVVSYSDAGRATAVKITGSKGTHIVTKSTITGWFNLYGNKFKIVKYSESAVAKVIPVTGYDGRIIDREYKDIYVINGDGLTVPLNQEINQVIVMGMDNIVNFPLVTANEGEYIFAGQGWGHGVGMSQSGAKGMAKQGYTYKQILEYYYTGTTVK